MTRAEVEHLTDWATQARTHVSKLSNVQIKKKEEKLLIAELWHDNFEQYNVVVSLWLEFWDEKWFRLKK